MSPVEIIEILNSSNRANPNRGIEEDDLLANKFISLSKDEMKSFWIAFAAAMKILFKNNESSSIYLASRFLYSMSVASPPRKPGRKSDFKFITKHDYSEVDPFLHAGALLASLVLGLGGKEFWESQKDISIENLNGFQEAFVMDAIVYAYIGLNRVTNVSAENWVNLFATLSRSSELPEFELLELLVSIDKENAAPSKWNEELELGLDSLKIATETQKYNQIHKELIEIFRAWLELNEPRPYISSWLKKQLNRDGREATSPKMFSLKHLKNQNHEPATA